MAQARPSTYPLGGEDCAAGSSLLPLRPVLSCPSSASPSRSSNLNRTSMTPLRATLAAAMATIVLQLHGADAAVTSSPSTSVPVAILAGGPSVDGSSSSSSSSERAVFPGWRALKRPSLAVEMQSMTPGRATWARGPSGGAPPRPEEIGGERSRERVLRRCSWCEGGCQSGFVRVFLGSPSSRTLTYCN